MSSRNLGKNNRDSFSIDQEDKKENHKTTNGKLVRGLDVTRKNQGI